MTKGLRNNDLSQRFIRQTTPKGSSFDKNMLIARMLSCTYKISYLKLWGVYDKTPMGE